MEHHYTESLGHDDMQFYLRMQTFTCQYENLHIQTSDRKMAQTNTSNIQDPHTTQTTPPRIYSIHQQQPSDKNHLYSPR